MNRIKEHINVHLKKYAIFVCVLALSLGIVIPITAAQKSADYYINAEIFYKECPDKDYHTEYANSAIYYATRGKTASSINRRRYGTIGIGHFLHTKKQI